MPAFTIHGAYYEANASRKYAATLTISNEGQITLFVDNQAVMQLAASELQISQRLGTTPRHIRFQTGALFETTENDAVDQVLRVHQPSPWSQLLHTLESRSRFLLPLILLAMFTGWATYSWGLPKLSRAIAYSIPAPELDIIGKHTIETLDNGYLSASGLSDEQQQSITARFEALTSQFESGFNYQLYFRQTTDHSANAFALPDGSIVLLDELIGLASDPWEIDSIVLHEIAHVEQRHALQMAFQNTLLSLSVSIMLGDAVSTSDALLSLPVLLVENRYSQGFEQAADDFASDYMLKHGIDSSHFSRMLKKVAQSNSPAKENPPTFRDYLSTHPQIESRISRIEEKTVRNK